MTPYESAVKHVRELYAMEQLRLDKLERARAEELHQPLTHGGGWDRQPSPPSRWADVLSRPNDESLGKHTAESNGLDKQAFLDLYQRLLAGVELRNEGDIEAAKIAWEGRNCWAMVNYLSHAAVLIHDQELEQERLEAEQQEKLNQDEARSAAEKRVADRLAQIEAANQPVFNLESEYSNKTLDELLQIKAGMAAGYDAVMSRPAITAKALAYRQEMEGWWHDLNKWIEQKKTEA